jgi:hypothetical protein
MLQNKHSEYGQAVLEARNKKREPESIKDDENSMYTDKGNFIYTDKKSGKYYSVDYLQKNMLTGRNSKSKLKYEAYPDPRMMNDFYDESNCIDGYSNISGICSCVSMINRLKGERIINIDRAVTLMKNKNLIEIKDAFEKNEKGLPVLDKNGQPIKLPFPDYEMSGAVKPEDMKYLFEEHGITSNLYKTDDKDNASVEKLIEHIMAGKAVGVSVSKQLLEGKPDNPFRPQPTEYQADVFISICGVYKQAGKDEIEGFFIKKSEDANLDLISLEEFKKVYYGSKEKPVKGGSVIVAEKVDKK